MTRFVIVTLLLAAIAVVLRLRGRGSSSTRSLKITARAVVGRGTSLVVVEVGGRRLLVGAAQNQMNLLAELGEDTSDDDVAVQSRDNESATTTSEWPVGRPPAPRARLNSMSLESDRSDTQSWIERIRSMTVRTADPELRGARNRTRRAATGGLR
ncbi:MAG: flagellar biosynthetic protein FliO [Actinomycetia bacterium]|nr:flagellar biosynthetic protein FliO [Actinomycetes bacterium]